VELVRICLKIEQLRRMTGMVDVFQRAERSRVTPPGEQVAWYSDSTGVWRASPRICASSEVSGRATGEEEIGPDRAQSETGATVDPHAP
jgi:hypothetical protein